MLILATSDSQLPLQKIVEQKLTLNNNSGLLVCKLFPSDMFGVLASERGKEERDGYEHLKRRHHVSSSRQLQKLVSSGRLNGRLLAVNCRSTIDGQRCRYYFAALVIELKVVGREAYERVLR